MSYSTIYNAIKADLESNPTKLLTSSYTIDGQSVSFKSIKEVIDLMGWLEAQIEKESNVTGFIGVKPNRFGKGY